LRSPGRIENSFANESFMDELAAAAKADPLEYRVRYMKDPRAIEAIQTAAKLANWQARPGPNPSAGSGDVVKGRGIAYMRYNNTITYVAAVAEVEVTKSTGDVATDYYSVKSGLKLMSTSMQGEGEEAVLAETRYTEYGSANVVDGKTTKTVKFPSKFKQTAGPQSMEFIFSEMRVNTKLNDKDFVVE
jgi:hypothetical protein